MEEIRETTPAAPDGAAGEQVAAEELAPVLVEAAEGFDLPEAAPAPPGDVPLAPAELIRLPARHNPRLQTLLQRVNADEDLHAIWRCQNVTAVDRLSMSDHGP